MDGSDTIKSLVRVWAPPLWPPLDGYLARRLAGKRRQTERAVIARVGLSVADGPFAGMRYVPEAVHSGFLPKLVGSYEEELHGFLAEAVAANPLRVIDIGCAEGYYAVGLARALPSATVYAVDVDRRARELCAEMAKRNLVADRVVLRDELTPHELNQLAIPGSLVVSDCEGCELDLLRLDLAPRLARCQLIVELHDCLRPDVTSTLVERFDQTHSVRLIGSRPRTAASYPAIQFLPPSEREYAVDDLRAYPMQWGYFLPRNTEAPATGRTSATQERAVDRNGGAA